MSFDILAAGDSLLALISLGKIGTFLLFLVGLSLVIFVHELGHFLVAKWCDIRIEKFAIGFGKELVGFTRGETRYSINALPLGGYVKMLGQEDFAVDKTGELVVKENPRSYTSKPVGQRMMVVSAGVIMNAIFAAVFFMVAFMIGMEVLPAKVGTVLPDRPAFRAGLRPGDQVLAINGHEVTEWSDMTMRITLSDPGDVMTMTVKNNGQIRQVEVAPEYNAADRLRQIGIANAQSLEIAYPGWSAGPDLDGQLQPGDRIVALQGQPVDNLNEVTTAIASAEGRPVQVTVERPVAGGEPERVTVQRRAQIVMIPPNDANLLGASPRVRIGTVMPNSAAARAGLREGDVVLDWDGIVNPTWDQIAANVQEYPDTEQTVQIARDGKPLAEPLFIRPEKPFTWSNSATPTIGVVYRGEIDEMNLVVAGVEPDSPFARAGLSKGDWVTTVAGEPVSTWYDLIHQLKQHSGQTVSITWQADSAEQSGEIRVPRSIYKELGLTPWPDSVITAVDGKKNIRTTDERGRIREFNVGTWEGTQAALQANVGREVRVDYLVGDQEHSKTVAVTQDLVDPWYMKIWYVEPFVTFPERETLQTSNPLVATWWGMKKTGYLMINMYITLKQMLFTQQIGVEHLSGPVGIMRIGTQVAESGMAQLIYFLAFLSANFAVVNFLPFPIVDGGHFMFLLIEKIKGRPLSVKVQMVTQVIGLAMILGAFVFLTVQDIILWNTR